MNLHCSLRGAHGAARNDQNATHHEEAQRTGDEGHRQRLIRAITPLRAERERAQTYLEIAETDKSRRDQQFARLATHSGFRCVDDFALARAARGNHEQPRILFALNPWYGLQFFMANGKTGFLVLGAIVLAVTGAEALYADMGHFGKRPIRLAWFGLVFPALLLNYFGQGALVLRDPSTASNPFFLLAPNAVLWPLAVRWPPDSAAREALPVSSGAGAAGQAVDGD